MIKYEISHEEKKLSYSEIHNIENTTTRIHNLVRRWLALHHNESGFSTLDSDLHGYIRDLEDQYYGFKISLAHMNVGEELLVNVHFMGNVRIYRTKRVES